MGIRLKILTIIILLSTIYATCKKDCVMANYTFKLGVKAFPNLDSVFIGDTIWLDVNEPTTLRNIETGTLVSFNNATNLGSNIGFQEVLSATQFRNAANDFKFKIIFGIETANTNPQLFRDYLFAEQNGRYLFKLGIVPLVVGVYRLGFGNAANVVRNNSPCERASFQIDFQQTDQHFYLYPGGAGTPPGGGVYYFKVK
jgi:hypothetical protein